MKLFKYCFLVFSLLLVSCGEKPVSTSTDKVDTDSVTNSSDTSHEIEEPLQLLSFNSVKSAESTNLNSRLSLRNDYLPNGYESNPNQNGRTVDVFENKSVTVLIRVKNKDRLSFIDLVLYSSKMQTMVVYNEGNGEYTCSSTTVFSSDDGWVTDIVLEINYSLIGIQNFGEKQYVELKDITFLNLTSSKVSAKIFETDIKKLDFRLSDYVIKDSFTQNQTTTEPFTVKKSNQTNRYCLTKNTDFHKFGSWDPTLEGFPRGLEMSMYFANNVECDAIFALSCCVSNDFVGTYFNQDEITEEERADDTHRTRVYVEVNGEEIYVPNQTYFDMGVRFADLDGNGTSRYCLFGIGKFHLKAGINQITFKTHKYISAELVTDNTANLIVDKYEKYTESIPEDPEWSFYSECASNNGSHEHFAHNVRQGEPFNVEKCRGCGRYILSKPYKDNFYDGSNDRYAYQMKKGLQTFYTFANAKRTHARVAMVLGLNNGNSERSSLDFKYADYGNNNMGSDDRGDFYFFLYINNVQITVTSKTYGELGCIYSSVLKTMVNDGDYLPYTFIAEFDMEPGITVFSIAAHKSANARPDVFGQCQIFVDDYEKYTGDIPEDPESIDWNKQE